MIRVRRGHARSGALLIALLVALCSAALVAPGAGAAVHAQAKGKVDKSAVIRVGAAIDAAGGPSFDPVKPTLNPANYLWMGLIYDTMIHPTAEGKDEPGLATKWTTPDASTVELTLRNGVKFSDGSPFNAAAVKKAWDKVVAANNAALPPTVKAISGIDAVGDNTVRVHFSQPVAQTFLTEIRDDTIWLSVPSPTAADTGNLNSAPVGAGPYKLDSAVSSGGFTLKPNTSYYDPKAQKAGGFNFVSAANGPPTVSALQAGTLDLALITPDAIETVESTPGLAVTSKPGTRAFDISLCTTSGPLASKEARQALQYALDKKAINEGAFSGKGLPTYQVLTPTSPFYNKSLEKTYSYNPKKAKTMLQEAGVAPGTHLNGLTNITSPQPVIAEITQSQLAKVGLTLDLTTSSNYAADVTRVKPDVGFVAVDPSLLTRLNGPIGALNQCGWTSAAYAAALAGTTDASKTPAQQQAAWDDLQKVLLDESPIVLSVVGPNLMGHKKNVAGIETFYSSTTGARLNTVYMTK